eukprot:g9023.t1
MIFASLKPLQERPLTAYQLPRAKSLPAKRMPGESNLAKQVQAVGAEHAVGSTLLPKQASSIAESKKRSHGGPNFGSRSFDALFEQTQAMLATKAKKKDLEPGQNRATPKVTPSHQEMLLAPARQTIAPSQAKAQAKVLQLPRAGKGNAWRLQLQAYPNLKPEDGLRPLAARELRSRGSG